jgi:hypothetical protein
MEAADSEAQLAGVMAHEISHVALRHATSQASRANIIQLPAVLAGAAIGDGSVLAQLGQLGLGLGVNSLILKYSRSAENEADALGAKIMAESGYDPVEMARFFEKLETEGGARAPTFLSSHPNPGDRVKRVQAEVATFPPRKYTAGSGRFPEMKRVVAQLPPPKNAQQQVANAAQSAPPPAASASDFRPLQTQRFALAYPNDWQAYGDERSAAVTIAPRQGLVRTRNGGIAIGYGVVLSYYQPQSARDLRGATNELLNQLQSMNPNLRLAGRQRQVRAGGGNGIVTYLSGSSPYGGAETNVVLTVARPQGLFYMVFVAPQQNFQQAEGTFQRILDSIQFRG